MIHHAFRSLPQFYRTPLWAVSHVAIINPLCPWDSWLFEVVLQAEFGPIYLKGIGGMQHVVDPMPNFMMGWNWLRGTLTFLWTCTYDWWKSSSCCVLLKVYLARKTTFVDEWHRQCGTMKSPRNVGSESQIDSQIPHGRILVWPKTTKLFSRLRLFIAWVFTP